MGWARACFQIPRTGFNSSVVELCFKHRINEGCHLYFQGDKRTLYCFKCLITRWLWSYSVVVISPTQCTPRWKWQTKAKVIWLKVLRKETAEPQWFTHCQKDLILFSDVYLACAVTTRCNFPFSFSLNLAIVPSLHFDGENRFHAGYFLPRCLIDDAEFSAHAKTRQTSDGRYLYFITWEEFPQFFRPLSPFLSLFPSFEITPGIEELISHRARGDPLARILVFLFRSTTC